MHIIVISEGSVLASFWGTAVVVTYKVSCCGLLIMSDCICSFLFATEGHHWPPLCISLSPGNAHCQRFSCLNSQSVKLWWPQPCTVSTTAHDSFHLNKIPTVRPFGSTARVANLLASLSSWTLGKDLSSPFHCLWFPEVSITLRS